MSCKVINSRENFTEVFVCEGVGVSLTGCQGLRAVIVVVLKADEGWDTSCGAQTLSQVGGCWVVGMHAVLR